MNEKTLSEADLANFTGDDHVFRHPLFNKRYTEGVRHVAEAGGAYWLLDVILSHQIDAKAKAEEFQVWRLKKHTVGGGCDVWMTDGNSETPIIRQRIEYTDFPLDEIMFFYENDTLCLPAERWPMASSEKKDPSAIILPFGKYKGRSVAEVLDTDPQYADWLVLQSWLVERFGEIHAAIQTRGSVSDETPEHNLIQARFLEKLFRVAFILAAHGADEVAKARAAAVQILIDSRQPRRDSMMRELRTERENVRHMEETIASNKKWAAKQTAEIRERDRDYDNQLVKNHRKSVARVAELEQKIADSESAARAIPTGETFHSGAQFEQGGVDVVVGWWFTTEVSKEYPGIRVVKESGIEIKPSLGDDFPAVMRQMERLGGTVTREGRVLGRRVNYLVIDRFAAVVPLEAVRGMFAANGRKLITVREIEAEIPNARALIAP